ncbi:MAG: hypothetical protein AAB403_17125 [Planctomycetota bacterium]
MVHELAGWLVNNIDLVLIFPMIAGLICLSLHRLGRLRHLRLAVYVSASFSLAFGYVYALSVAFSLLAAVMVFAPQTFVLVIMGGSALVTQWRNSEYNAPSPLWVVGVAVLGHCWTRLSLLGLSGS